MNLSDFINFYKENLTTRGLMKKKYKAHYIIPIGLDWIVFVVILFL